MFAVLSMNDVSYARNQLYVGEGRSGKIVNPEDPWSGGRGKALWNWKLLHLDAQRQIKMAFWQKLLTVCIKHVKFMRTLKWKSKMQEKRDYIFSFAAPSGTSAGLIASSALPACLNSWQSTVWVRSLSDRKEVFFCTQSQYSTTSFDFMTENCAWFRIDVNYMVLQEQPSERCFAWSLSTTRGLQRLSLSRREWHCENQKKWVNESIDDYCQIVWQFGGR